MTDTVFEQLAGIRARANAASKGPWHWAGNTDSKSIYLAHWVPGMGRCTVMDFTRWGMQGARPRFADDLMMKNADTMPVFEVSPKTIRRDDPAVYRADLIGIRHPDAEFIAAARTDVPALLDIIEQQSRLIAKVQSYADDRSIHAGRRNSTVSSWRVASDLIAILGRTDDAAKDAP